MNAMVMQSTTRTYLLLLGKYGLRVRDAEMLGRASCQRGYLYSVCESLCGDGAGNQPRRRHTDFNRRRRNAECTSAANFPGDTERPKRLERSEQHARIIQVARDQHRERAQGSQ